jgi:hypothetical protein
MPKYVIASEEGAQRYGAEIGDTVDLKLEPQEELAVTAAGWIAHDKKQAKEANK